MRPTVVITLVVAAALGEPRPARAGCSGTVRWEPRIARDPATHTSLVVWSEESLASGCATFIRGALRDRHGNAIGGDFGVSDEPSHAPAAAPHVVHRPSRGDFLVAWFTASPTLLQVRRVAADGTLAGDELLVTPFSSGLLGVAHDPASERTLIVWRAGQELGTSLLDGDGAVLVSTMHELTPADLLGAAVAFDPESDRFLVVWADDRVRINGQLVDLEGALLGGSFTISEAPGERFNPAVDAREGGFLVAWQDGRSSPTMSIYAQLVGADGTLVDHAGDGSPSDDGLMISSDPVSNALRPVVTADPRNHRSLISWNDGSALRAQLVDDAGALVGSRFVVMSDRGHTDVAYASDCQAYQAALDPVPMDLTAGAYAIGPCLSPGEHDFGEVVPGAQSAPVTFTLDSSIGPSGMITNMMAVPGAEVVLAADGCTNDPIEDGATCSFELRFAPTTEGALATTWSIATDFVATPSFAVTLRGTTPGAAVDAGVPDGAVAPDAARAPDAAGEPGGDSGCGCAASRDRAPALWPLALLLLLSPLRRRRKLVVLQG
jgi:MYXO-CTERM domain-containing protein